MRISTATPAILLIAGWLCLFTLPALAQPGEDTFERLTTADGLAGNAIFGIAQDQQGFMWFATDGGLSKYDGYDFTTYSHDPLDSTSLAENALSSLFVDSRGTLWVGTMNSGLDRFDAVTEIFAHFPHDPEDPTSLSNKIVTAILEDHKGTLWVGSFGGGLNRFDHETKTFTHFPHDPYDPASLSNDNVRVLYEDRQGILWVGTANGFNRFNPTKNSFKRYHHDPDDERTLIDDYIGAIYEDSQGTFWVGTLGDGLHTMDRETGAFTRYTYDPGHPNRPHGPRLAADSEENITTIGGVFGVRSIHEDDSGALWIGGNGGLNRYDGATGTLTHYEHGDFRRANTDFRIYESREGALWIGTWNGLYRVPPQPGSFERIRHDPADANSLSSNIVSSIVEDASGVLWIGTFGGGLNRYEKETGKVTHYRHDPENPNSLSNDNIRVVYEAPSNPGVLWIGMDRGGLNRFEVESETITHYLYDPGNPNSLYGDDVWVIYEAPSEPGVLWIGGFGMRFYRFELNTESFTVNTALPRHRYRPELLRSLKELDQEDRSIAALLGMGNNENRSHPFKIVEETPTLIVVQGDFNGSDAYDYGWIENEEGEIVWNMRVEKTRAAGGIEGIRSQIAEIHLSPGSYRLRYRSDDNTSYGDNWGGYTPPDDPERWGIQMYSLQGRAPLLAEEDTTDIELSGAMSGSIVFSVLEDGAGALWVGTYNGLNTLDRETSTFTTYLRGRQISVIHQDQRARFWLGTNSGLLRFDQSRAREAIEAEKGKETLTLDQLSRHAMFGIVEDEEGMLWINSTSGLSRYNPETRTFTHFEASTGGGLFRGNTARSRSGELFFGGDSGVLHFFPDRILNMSPPAPALTDLRIFNESVVPEPDKALEAPIGMAESITLTNTQRDFAIDFAGLHYSDPARNRYMYQLDGYDEDWVRAGTQRSARYTNLPPGSYTFRMKAANSDGIWSEEEATIGVTLLPPWWRTVWAFVVYGLLFVAGVVAVDRVQRKRLIARERLRAEREKARAIESMNTELQRALKHLTETQDQLIHTEKMASLGQLTAGIAHEIKNPLNFVNNFAEISANITEEIYSILEKEKTNLSAESAHELKAFLDDLKMNTQKINEHGRRADGIVRAMLEHSRTGPGERRAVEVNALLDEYVNLAYHSWQAANPRSDTIHRVDPRVCRSYDDAVGEVEIVPQELGRVFVNLLDNAFYAVNEKRVGFVGDPVLSEGRQAGVEGYAPEVSVSTRRAGDGIEIRVEDNGVGIPRQARDRIFEPFFTTKPAGSGTGLGLSLSYDIVVKGHGGSLTVESEEGEGAVFVIVLPVEAKSNLI